MKYLLFILLLYVNQYGFDIFILLDQLEGGSRSDTFDLFRVITSALNQRENVTSMHKSTNCG